MLIERASVLRVRPAYYLDGFPLHCASVSAPRLSLLALLLCLTSACDPCSGVIGCANGRYLSAAGQIVDPVTGDGLDGVRIDVVRTGGIEVDVDSIAVTTAGGGFWRAELSARAPGTVVADMRVSAPGWAPYRLKSVSLATHEHRGDANLNQRWIPFLYFDYVGEFYLSGTADTRPEGIMVEFRRTSGAVLTGPGQDRGTYRAPTNIAGRIHLYPTTGDSAVFALDDAPLTGDLIVHLSATDSTFWPGVQLTPKNTFRDRRDFPPVIRIAVGP